MTLNRRQGAAGTPKGWDGRPFRVIAFDPGGTTGWASANWLPLRETDSLSSIEDIEFSSGQIGPGEHHLELWKFLHRWANGHSRYGEVACELFEFRQHVTKEHTKTKVELISNEYIGIIKLFAITREIDVNFQNASSAKTFIPDKGPQANVRLHQLGLYEPGQTHANDAKRHLLRHLVITKKIRFPITNHWL